MAGAESRARDAEQDAARAREAADRQVAQVREDAARDQARAAGRVRGPDRSGKGHRAALQARAERAEAELRRALADRAQAPEKAAPAQPPRPARRRRRPPET